MCVYVGGELVVDLWGSMSRDGGYGPDTLHSVFSCGKNLEAIATAMLVDRKLVQRDTINYNCSLQHYSVSLFQLDYSDPISSHWPEFGQNGKSGIMVEDVLRHESGLPFLSYTFSPKDLMKENIKKVLTTSNNCHFWQANMSCRILSAPSSRRRVCSFPPNLTAPDETITL